MSVGSLAPVSELHESVPADRDLIARTLAGDESAFAALIERFQRKIFRVAYAVVRDDAEADAVTQDTFVQAYTNLRRFEGRAEFETWLTRIAINRARDVLRRRRFVAIVSVVPEPVDTRPGPERELMAAELRSAIARAEEKLSPKQKMIFRLRHYDNRTPEEIAVLLALRPATVRVHLFRAVHKIRQELAAWR